MTDIDQKLEAVQARREKKRAEIKAKRDAQLAIDYDAIADLEDSLGPQNVQVLTVEYIEDLPAAVAVRTPKTDELKRYRDMLRGENPDPVKAAEALGHVTRIYPDADTFELMCAQRPGLKVQMGTSSVRLGSAKADADAKS